MPVLGARISFGKSCLMSLKVRLVLGGVAAVVAVAGLVCGWGVWAVGQVEPFYEAALAVDDETLQEAGHELESRVSVLLSDASREAEWQAVIPASEVNGWLATDLREKFPEALSEEVEAPRVAIFDDALTVGFRYEGDDLSTVVTVKASVAVSDGQTVAVRFLGAWAGSLPIPLIKVIEPLSQSAEELGIHLNWTQDEGAPVALLSLEEVLAREGKERRLKTIELYEGEVYLTGTTVEAAVEVAGR